MTMMIRSLHDCGGYIESNFCKQMDEELFPQLDGTPMKGPGLYTSQSIREVWRQRTIRGIGWLDTGRNADTTEAIDRTLAIAIRYATRPKELAAAITSDNLQPPKPGDPDPPQAGRFSSPDALLTPSYMAATAVDPDIKIDPAWKVSLVYGMPCAIYHQLSAAYYLAARFSDDFDSAVLHAINGGGQNQVRAILAGSLVGAQVGLSGIPDAFYTRT